MDTASPHQHAVIQIKGSELLESTEKFLAPEEQHSVVIAIPWTDPEKVMQTVGALTQRAGYPASFLLLEDDTRAGPTRLLNQCFVRTAGIIFGYLAQDVFPGRDWLSIALKAMKASKNPGLLAFNDGKWHGQLASFGLVNRQWVDTIYSRKGIFFRGYWQHYGDTELTLIAREQKRYVYDPHALMIEVDYKKDTASAHRADKALFHQRKNSGFDGNVTNPALLGLFG
jgi:hypothetical protein